MKLNKMTCPNCGHNIAGHADNGCVLGAFFQVVRERQEISERKLRKLWAATDADRFWDNCGRITDDLQAGKYSEVTS